MKVFENTRAYHPGSFLRRAGVIRIGAGIACGLVCSSVLGCGSSQPKPQVGSINFTDVLGGSQPALTEMKAGTATYLDVVVGNDPEFLGANWSVRCSNQPPVGTPLPPNQPVDMSCGSFSPVHTLTAPVPAFATSGAGIVTVYTAPAMVPKDGTVTLYASATSDPSQYSAITLTITSK